jgi:hypothetical protein
MASGFEMRVGDADREAAAAELREHYASGRLTQDELNERLDQAFAAKTRADLNGIFTDLPSGTRSDAAGDARTFGQTGPFGQAGPFGTGGPYRGNGPFGGGPGGSSGPSGPGGYARRAIGAVVIPIVLLWVLLALGILGVFGIGAGRPFGIVLILAAFALLRRLLFVIFGRGRGRGCGPRRRRR